jgi:serine protease Do
MTFRHLLVVQLFILSGVEAQLKATHVAHTSSRALHDFSVELDRLSRKADRSVVQVFATSYSFSEGGDSSKINVLSRQRSSGSGAVLSADGFIITNNHVVQGARRVQVQFAGSDDTVVGNPESLRRPVSGRIEAKVVGTDRASDLALLKVEGSNLPYLALGDSDELHKGQLVLAFGSPLGLENSATMGIVSSTNRRMKPDEVMEYIQTDASVNPGNSGGPLLDVEGNVVGINTFIVTQSGGNEGIGFAIPSNIVRNVYNQIRTSGHVHRGSIGVSVQTLTPELANALRLTQERGVLLADVFPGGPADLAGLRVDDIVLASDDRPVNTARQLEIEVYCLPVAKTITLQILRDKEQFSFQVPIIEREDDPQRFADMVDPDKDAVPKLGILGLQIDQKMAAILHHLRKQYGVIVAAKGYSGAYSGKDELKEGDVIYAVNRLAVVSVDGLRQAIDALDPLEPLVLQVEREGRLTYLSLALD